MTADIDLDRVYEHRFGGTSHAVKDAIWTEVATFLQRWVPADGAVLDVACDRGYFIRHIRASERWATDIRDMSTSLGSDVRFVRTDGLALSKAVPANHFDVVFMSNYLEHLQSSDAVIAQLAEARAVINERGRLIVLQPNVRLVGAAYWDFIDHRVPLTERSLVEAANAAGFDVEHLIVRFLPYTTKSRIPSSRWLVRAYLKLPIAWRFMGKQTLLVARPRRGS